MFPIVCYLICIGFLHLVLLAVSITIIVVCSKIIDDEYESLIYRTLSCYDNLIIFLLVGVFNLLLFIISAVSSFYTWKFKEFRALYRLVALVAITAMIFDLVFIIWTPLCVKSEKGSIDFFRKKFKNYGRYEVDPKYYRPEEMTVKNPCIFSNLPPGLSISHETKLFNYIQSTYHCCGVEGKYDYYLKNMSLPESCCGTTDPVDDNARSANCSRYMRQPDESDPADPTPESTDSSESTESTNSTESPMANVTVYLLVEEIGPPCYGCVRIMRDQIHTQNLNMWIVALIKFVLDLYVATSSCFILIAEAPKGKYPA